MICRVPCRLSLRHMICLQRPLLPTPSSSAVSKLSIFLCLPVCLRRVRSQIKRQRESLHVLSLLIIQCSLLGPMLLQQSHNLPILSTSIHTQLKTGMVYASKLTSCYRDHTAKTKYQNFAANIPRKWISGSQSLFPHSWVCEWFIYSHHRSAYSAGGNM
jgi:hypothetical protein